MSDYLSVFLFLYDFGLRPIRDPQNEADFHHQQIKHDPWRVTEAPLLWSHNADSVNIEYFIWEKDTIMLLMFWWKIKNEPSQQQQKSQRSLFFFFWEICYN